MQYARLGIGGKLQAAVLFLNDHRKEAMLFQVRPQLRRQISHFMGNFEVVRHAAGFFYWAVDESLLFGGEARLRIVMQLVPVRVAAEQIAFPPGGAGIDGLFFRTRHRRHYFAEGAECRGGEKGFTHRRKVERQQDNRQRQQQPDIPQPRHAERRGPGEQNHAAEKQADSVIEEHAE